MKRFAAAIVLTLGFTGLGAQTTVSICDRTDEVEAAILAETATDNDVCGAVLVSELEAITDLNLDMSRIRSLQADDFSRLTGLRTLDLSSNSLGELPERVFSGLTGLQTLDLGGNSLEGLPQRVFSGLASLRTLDLSATDLDSLHDSIFSGLASLRTLDLKNNALMRLPPNIFLGLTNLQTLDLSINNLNSLPANIFSATTDLRTLDLSDNALANPPANVFSKLVNLQTLSLARNNFRGLPRNLFSALASLQTLNLEGNDLEELPHGIFRGLTGLTGVDLSGNTGSTFMLTVMLEVEPVSLPDDFTSATVKLVLREGAPRPITVSLSPTGADLSAGSLTIPTGGVESEDVVVITRVPGAGDFGLTLDSLTFGGSDDNYDGLEIVTGEPVGSPPVNICGRTVWVQREILEETATDGDTCDAVFVSELASITELHFPSSGIMALRPGDFADLTGLQTLNLFKNGLEELPPGIFADLINLQTLILEYNSLYSLPAGIFADLTSLQTLNLENNFFEELSSGVFTSLTGLRTLNLKDNLFGELPSGVFTSLTGLQTLNLKDNGLYELPPGIFAGLTGLQILNLEDNRLEELPSGIFADLTALQTLNLEDNFFEELPSGVFTGLTVLQTLRLAYNDLYELPPGIFADLIGLQTLRLEYNDLDELPPGVFAGLTGLQTLNLAHNDLYELPPGVFSGLSNLEVVHLHENSIFVDYFELALRLKSVGETELSSALLASDPVPVRLTLAAGAPYPLEVNFEVSGVTLSTNMVTISAGSTQSAIFTVTRSSGSLSIGFTEPPPPPNNCDSDERHDEQCFTGLAVVTGKVLLSFTDSDGIIPVLEGGTAVAPFNLDVAFGVPTEEPLVVQYRVTGDSADAADYDVGSGLITVTVPAGSTTGEIRILIRDDEDIEPPRERFFLRLYDLPPATGYGLGEKSSVTIVIKEGICDRTPVVVNRIRNQINPFTPPFCEDVRSADLNGITEVDISYQDVESLKSKDFSGLNSMTRVVLSGNPFMELPPKLFDGLAGLTTIELSQNQLTTLPDLIFSGLTGLRSLLLHDGTLSVLPEGIFSGLRNLSLLRLDANQLTALPPGVFSGLSNLDALHLGGNPRAPFRLALRLESAGETALSSALLTFDPVPVRLTLSAGAPYPVEVRFEASGVTLSTNPVTISAGSMRSATFTVIRSGGPFSIGFAELSPPPDNCSSVQKIEEQCFTGFEIAPDGARPQVSTIRFTSVPQSPNTYAAESGETIDVEVVFSRKVIVISDGVASPTLTLKIGGNTRTAAYVPGRSGGDVLSFSYTLMDDDLDEDGVSVAPGGLQPDGSSTVTGVFGPADLTLAPRFLNDRAGHKVAARVISLWFTDSNGEIFSREGSTAVAEFALDATLRETLVVHYTVTEGSADADDYDAGSGMVEVPEGSTSGSILIPIKDDDDIEPVRDRFGIELVPGFGYTPISGAGARTTLTVMIQEGVCDRTPEVRDRILEEVSGKDECEDPNSRDLRNITSLSFSGGRLGDVTTFKSKDFSGFTYLRQLFLSENKLTELPQGLFDDFPGGSNGFFRLHIIANELIALPPGIFSGLSGLRTVHLHDNPGAPFRLALRLESAGETELSSALLTFDPVPVRLTLAEGAPYNLEVRFDEVSGATLSASSVTISAGATQSEEFTVTRDSGATSFRISFAELSPPPNDCKSGHQHEGQCYTGFEIEVLGFPIVYAPDRPGPQVSTIQFTSIPQNPNTYSARLGETIDVNVVFDRGVIVTSSPASYGTTSPTLVLQVGDNRRTAAYVRGRSGGDVLSFSYTLMEGELDEDGVSVADQFSLRLNGTTVTDVFGRAADVTLAARFLPARPGHRVWNGAFLRFTDSDGTIAAAEGETVVAAFELDVPFEAPLTVRYTVTGDSAVADDYDAGSGMVELPAGSTAGEIRIFIRDDEDIELPLEVFHLDLDLSDGYALGERPGLRLEINEGVCDRTPQVRDILRGGRDCDEVRSNDLQVMTTLSLSGQLGSVEILKSKDLSGLSRLTQLFMSNNQLTELPQGLFSGLSGLRTVHLRDNPGAPFRLVLRLESVGGMELASAFQTFDPVPVRLTLAEGAPYSLEIRFDGVSGVTLSTGSVTIPAGATQSEAFTVTKDSGADSFRIGFAELPPPNTCQSGHRHEGQCFTGIEVAGSPIVYAPDGPGPQVSTIRFTSVPQNPNIYSAKLGETIDVNVVFDRGVIVTSSPASYGTTSPTLVLQVGDNRRTAVHVPSRSGGDVLSFSYALVEGDSDEDGVSVADESSLRLNGSTITDVFGRAADSTLAAHFLAARPGHGVWDGALLSFTASDGIIEVLESGTAVAVFHLDEPFDAPFTFLYTVTEDSADADDYVALSGMVTMPAGSTTGEIRVFIRDDEDVEPPRERLSLRLAGSTDYALGATPSVTIVIKEGICDRTPVLINRIRLRINMLVARDPFANPLCEDVRSADLNGVTGSIGISYQDIGSLKSKDFSGLNSLKVLSLAGNRLVALPPTLFDGLVGLTSLDMRENRLTTLPGGIFSELTSLETLQVYENPLSSLPEGIFSGLRNLRILQLHDNQLTALPPGVFSGLSNLGVLHLSGNPGAPFELALRLEPVGGTALSEALLAFDPVPVRLALPAGAPYPLEFNFEVSGVTLSTNRVAISAGSTRSATFTVTRSSGLASIIFAEVSSPPDNCASADQIEEQCFTGFEIAEAPIVYVPDGPAPQVSTIEFTSVPKNMSIYSAKLGETIDVDVIFDMGVIVTSSPTSYGITSPTLTLQVGDNRRTAIYAPGRSGGKVLSFSYTLIEGELDEDGVSVADRFSLQLNGSTITGVFGRAADLTLADHLLADRPGHGVWNGAFLSFTDSDRTIAVPEGETAVAAFHLDAPFEAPLDVHYVVTEDSADADDYVAVSGMVTMPAGSTTGEIRVFIRDDEDVEPPRERLSLRLAGSTDYALGATPSVTIVIKEGICDRTPVIVDRISRLISLTPPSCEDVRRADLSGVTGVLSIGDLSTVTSLKSEDFSGLNSLSRVVLSSNQLTVLPPKLLDGLAGLEIFELTESPLTTLPGGSFLSGLTSLESIFLYDNALSALPERIFSGLRSLSILRLEQNQLTALPPGVFSGLSSLEALHLSDNPGAPFELALRLESVDGMALSEALLAFDPAPAMLTLPAGAPYPVDVRFEVSGVTLSTNPVTISAGSTQSAAFTVTRSSGSFSIGLAELSPPPDTCSPAHKIEEQCFTGFQIAPVIVYVQDEVVNICARTDAVEAAILAATPAADVCRAVLASELRATTELNLAGSGITSLQSGDFSGLTGLQTLDLSGNGLAALPAGVFAGLVNLTGVDLSGNSVPAFTLTVETEFELLRSPGNLGVLVKLVLREGAPRLIRVDVSTTGGATLSTDFLTIPTGGVESVAVTFTRTSGDVPFELILDSLTLGGMDDQYAGIEIVAPQSVEEQVIDVCDRTDSIEDVILDMTSADACETVFASELRAITELNLAGLGITSLQADDFAALSGLQTLDLSNNGLTALPAGVFADLRDLRTLDLADNRLDELPAGVFAGLTSLTGADLSGNSGTTFTLTVRPEIELSRTSAGSIVSSVRLMLSEGAPRSVTVDIVAVDATPGANSATIPAGSVESDVFTVTRASDNASFGLSLTVSGLGGEDGDYPGVTITTEASPIVFVNVCARTDDVEFGILTATATADTCDAVLASELEAITELNFAGSGIMALQAGDFAGLTALQTLDLSGNGLTELSAGVFAGPDGLQTLDLSGNGLTELPAGVFAGLDGLTGLDLSDNPGTTFTLTVNVELTLARSSTDSGVFTAMVKSVLREGAPRRIGVILQASGAAPSSRVLTIPTGGVESNAATFTRVIFSTDPLRLTPGDLSLSGADGNYDGFDVVAGEVFINICARTDAVEVAILAATDSADDLCEAVPASELTAITELDLAGAGTASLQADDFAGLFGLQTLDLRDNALGDLPAGIFSGLTGLTGLDLSGNPDSTFNLTVRTEFDPSPLPDDFTRAEVKLVLAQGAPRPVTVRFVATGAALSGYSLTIPTGGVESDGVVVVTRPAGSAGSFDLIAASPPELGGRDADYGGFDIDVDGEENVINVCGRTDEVWRAILAATPADDACEAVLASELRATTELNLAGSGIASLQADDFAVLTGLQALDLSGNALTGLPPGVFAETTGLRALNLRGNNLNTLPAGVFSRLTNLRTLDLADNRLDELPAGVFAGLTGLMGVDLSGNAVSMFMLTVRLETGMFRTPGGFIASSIKLMLSEGAPRAMTVDFSTVGAEPSSGFLTIPTGSVESSAVVIVHAFGRTSAVLTWGALTFGGIDVDYSGFDVDFAGETITMVDTQTVYLTLSDLVVEQGGSATVRVAASPPLRPGQSAEVTVMIPDALFGDDSSGQSRAYFTGEASSNVVTFPLSFELNSGNQFRDIGVHAGAGLTGAGFGGSVADPTPGIYEQGIAGWFSSVAGFSNPVATVSSPAYGRILVGLRRIEVGLFDQSGVSSPLPPLLVPTNAPRVLRLMQTDAPLRGSQAAALRISVEGAGLGVSRSLGGAASGSLDVALSAVTSAVDFFVSATQEGVSGTLSVTVLGTSGVDLRTGQVELPVKVPVRTRVFFVPDEVTLEHGLEHGGAGGGGEAGVEVEVRTDPPLQAGDPALLLTATRRFGTRVVPEAFDLTPENPTTTLSVFLAPEERSGFFTSEITLSNRNAGDPRETILMYEPLRVTAVRTVVVSLEKTDAGSPFVVGEETTVTVATSPTLAPDESVLVSLTAGAGLTVVGDPMVALSNVRPNAEVVVRPDDSGERTLEAIGVGTNVAVSSGASLTAEVLGRLSLRFEPSRLRVEQGRSATFNVTTSPLLTGSDSATVRLTVPAGWGLGERRVSSLELSLDAATPMTEVRVTAPAAALGPVSVDSAQQAAGFVFFTPTPLKVEAFRVLSLSFGALTTPVVAGGGRSTALLTLGNTGSLLAGERLTIALAPSDGLELTVPVSGMVVMDGGASSRVETSLRAKLDASLAGESLRASLTSLEPPGQSSYTRVNAGVLDVAVERRVLTASFSPPEVTLVRGGAAPPSASTRVTLEVSPELQGGERIEVNLTPGAGLGVVPAVVTLSSVQRTVEVEVSADSAAGGEVAAAEGAGTSIGGAAVSFEALRVEVIRGVEVLLGGSSSPAVLAFAAGEGADLLVSTTPTLETNEEVTVRLSVPGVELASDVVLLNAANPEAVVRVNTDTPRLRTTVVASGTGAGVAVVGDEAAQRIRTRYANELSLEVSPSEVLVEQASSARVTVTTSPALGASQFARVRLELAEESGLSFTGGLSSVEVALNDRALSAEVPVFASVEVAIGSTAAMMVTWESASMDVGLTLPSPAPFVRVAPPRVSVGFVPEGGELGEAVTLDLDATGRVTLRLTDYVLSGSQRAVLEARVEGPGLSLIEGGAPAEAVEVVLTPMARAATLTVRSSPEALPGVLRVRAIGGVALKAPASVRIDARQMVALESTPSPLVVEQGRSTELRVASVSPIAPNRSATVTLTAPAGVLLNGAASTDLVFDAAAQSRTVEVAALHSVALGEAALGVEVQQTPGLLLVSPPFEVALEVVAPRVAVSLSPPALSLAQGASGEVGLRLRDYELMRDQHATLRVTVSSGLTLGGGASEQEVPLSAQAPMATVTVTAGMTPGVERLQVSASSGIELSQDAVLEVSVLQRVAVRFTPAMVEVSQGQATRLRVTTDPPLEPGWSVTVSLSVELDSGVRFDGAASTELTLSGDGAGSQEVAVTVSALPDAGIASVAVTVSASGEGDFWLESALALSVAVVLPLVSVSLTPAGELVLESGSVLESSKNVVLRLEHSELPSTQSVSLRVRLDSAAGLSLSQAGSTSVQTDLSLSAENNLATVTVSATPNVTGTGTLTVTAMEGVRLRPEPSLAITVTTPRVTTSFEPAQLMIEPESSGTVTVRLCRPGRSDVASCTGADYPLVPAQDVRLEASASSLVFVPGADGVTIENGVATLAFGRGREKIEMAIEFASDDVKNGELIFRAVRGVVLVDAEGDPVEKMVLQVSVPSIGTRLRIRVFLEGALE